MCYQYLRRKWEKCKSAASMRQTIGAGATMARFLQTVLHESDIRPFAAAW
jgi:hypothetical protein